MSRYSLPLFLLLVLASCKGPSDPLDPNDPDPVDSTKPKVFSTITGNISRAHFLNALEGVRITSTPATRQVMTDADGNYRIDSVVTGTYMLSFEKAGFAQAIKNTIITDSNTKVIDVRLDELSSNGKGIAHITVLDSATKKPLRHVEFLNGDESIGFTDDNGLLTIEKNAGSGAIYGLVRPGCERISKSVTFSKPIVTYDTVLMAEYAPMLAWYTFAKNGRDSSGNGFDLEMNGGKFVDDRNGLKERAIEFDGLNDFLRLAHKQELNFGVTDDLTICFWIKCSGTRPDHEGIMHKSQGTGKNFVGYEVGLNSADAPYASQELTVGTDLGMQREDQPYAGDYAYGYWQLFTVRIDRKARLIDFWETGYDFEAQILGGNMDNGGDLIIGRGSNGAYFKGALDEIMIFKGYLKPQDLGYIKERK